MHYPFPWRPPELEKRRALHPHSWFSPVIEHCRPPGVRQLLPYSGYYFVRQVQNELGINYEIQEAQGFFETFFEMFPQIPAYQARAAEDALSLDRVYTIGGTRGAGSLRFWRIARATTGRHSNGARRS